MVFLDYLVLLGYFVLVIGIGIYSARKDTVQEDFFLGGRSFGKLLQTFAAFGAGTGSSDPVVTARTTFTSGMSGMWSVMYWLFVTPFYWIAAIWYRRMRHLTLGDWFVERYESKALGAAYCVFGVSFFMVYGSMFFSAIGKVAAPLLEFEVINLFGEAYPIEYVLVPVIGVVVLVYGILGGLRAAYFTDLVQGICIIVLSIILVPYGLRALVEKFGDPASDDLLAGFTYMHQQLPPEHFDILGSNTGSEFPLHRIIAVVLINLVGIVVQPHFIATGGGSAKTENTARVGLVVGNFLKRFCTVGWVLTALIALALYADDPELLLDPGKTWGVASRELLGAGLTGLMLACLLAALMSSIDAYMIVGSALMARNIVAPYVNPNASEQYYVNVGRFTGAIIVGGAVIISLFYMDVFEQLQLTWVFNVLFAAPFWIGMYWRRATTLAAWITVAFNVLVFFVVPYTAPRLAPTLRDHPSYLLTNNIVRTVTKRPAAPTDIEKRNAEIANWETMSAELAPQADEAGQEFIRALDAARSDNGGEDYSLNSLRTLQLATERLRTVQQQLSGLGDKPLPLQLGDEIDDTQQSGGMGVFWPGGVKPIDEDGNVLTDVLPQPVGEPRIVDNTTEVTLRYPDDVRLRGFGNFQLDFLLYKWVGVPLQSMSDAALDTLSLPPKIITPFLVMILFSLITRRNSEEGLDRYYAKMKTPVDPDPQTDRQKVEQSYAQREQLESKKLLPGSSFEFQKPTAADVIGFIVCFAVCFGIIWLASYVASFVP